MRLMELLRGRDKPTDRLEFWQVRGKTGRHEKIETPAWLGQWFREGALRKSMHSGYSIQSPHSDHPHFRTVPLDFDPKFDSEDATYPTLDSISKTHV